MARLMLFCLAFCLAVCVSRADVVCLDETGSPVDWFVLYKLPLLKTSKDYLLRKGLSYMYITSRDPDADWKLSQLSVNDTRSIPARTLAPLYASDNSELFHVLYNDKPPNASDALTFGHTKGVVLSKSSGGLWLIHSVPNFPLEPVSKKTNKINKYQYPQTGLRMGQSFLCISLAAKEMNNVGTQLMFNKPKIYSSNIPEFVVKSFGNMTEASIGRYVKKAPWKNKVVFKSKGGVEFTSYAKTAQFGDDLYAAYLAPDVGGDFEVETWSNGAGELPSDCRSKYHVMDVTDISTKLNNSLSIQFKNSIDHSKWAVTASSELKTVCIGDINRMSTQFKRGGGTVCLRNANLWKRYQKSVLDYQPCPRT